MAKVCDNLPINTVGPFEQTLFLGCSVQSMSTSLGWNEQQSTLTVNLVEDTCPATKENPKVIILLRVKNWFGRMQTPALHLPP